MKKVLCIVVGRGSQRRKYIEAYCELNGIEIIYDNEIKLPHKENPMWAFDEFTESAVRARKAFSELSLTMKPKKNIPFYESLNKYKRKF